MVKKEMIYLFRLCATALVLLFSVQVNASAVDSLRRVVDQSEGKDKSNAYDALRGFYQNHSQYDEELALLEEWTAYERQEGDFDREGKVRWSKIALLSNLGLDEALLTDAPVQMAWFEEHEQWDNYYNTWESKASTFLYTGKLQTALREAKLMLSDAQQRDNNYGRVVSYLLTGLTYQSLHQNDVAIENLMNAYQLLKQGNDNPSMFTSTCDYLCQTLDDDKQYEKELAMTEEWLKAIEKQRAKDNKGKEYMSGTALSCHIQRASALMGMARTDEAEEELEKAQEYLEYINIPLTQFRVGFCHARLLLDKQKYPQALACLDSLKAMELEVGGSIDILRAGALMEMGCHEEAAQIYQKEYFEQDSIFGNEMRTQLSEMAALYQADEEHMKARLERTYYITVIVVIILVAMLLLFVLRYLASKRLAQKNQELEDANRQLQLAHQRVEDASKMKMDFIKGISHEIRTPLNILSGFTQVITTPGMNLPQEELASFHKRINENTDRIVELVNKLLELSDSNSHAPLEREDSVSACELVDLAISHVNLKATEAVALDWDRTDPLADTLLVTNKRFAVRAFECLLDNARKFTRQGKIAIRLKMIEDQMRFIVEDTGIGVQPDQAERIFEEFVQIDNYSEGAGIGLTVARSIARRLDGDILLDTSYTPGSRFVMWLPTMGVAQQQ